MGYAHYWSRPAHLDRQAFERFAQDCGRIVETARAHRFALSGPGGVGEPVINPAGVAFNGAEACGHEPRDLVAPWPTEDAAGVAHGETPLDQWFGGDLVDTRLCNGDCSYEDFWIDRDLGPRARSCGSRISELCKTGFRPYDVVVTACLLMLAYRFGDTIALKSDGTSTHWYDGQHLCLLALGILPPIPMAIGRAAAC